MEVGHIVHAGQLAHLGNLVKFFRCMCMNQAMTSSRLLNGCR